ncbi:MAG: MarR family transcriptional regulator [Proteobacteria bacterium]|nr:MarR family transcriptional regulator [Pseudomonadota bacterium]
MTIPDPTDCPYYLISRTTLVVTAALRKELAASGAGQVRVSYLGALMVLWRQDDLKSGDLGRRAGLEPSTMTGLLDRMARDNLVVRIPDPKDRRAQRIRLTDEGRRLREPIVKAVDKTFEQVFSGVPEEEITHLKDILRTILSNSNKTSNP